MSTEKTFNLTFKFPTHEARETFASWLCNCAEQDYWGYCDIQGENKVGFTWHKKGEFRAGSKVGVTDHPHKVVIPTHWL